MSKIEEMFALIEDQCSPEFAALCRAKYEAGSTNCVADAIREWYGLDEK